MVFCVSCGVSFVGLIESYIMRVIVGSDNRILILESALEEIESVVGICYNT